MYRYTHAPMRLIAPTVMALISFLCLGLASPIAADPVGGELWHADFDPSSLADTVAPLDFSSGSFFAGPPEWLLDGDLVTGWLYLYPGDSVVLGFSDNVAVNGEGDDVAIFEWGLPETVDVRIADPSIPEGWSEALMMDSYPTGAPLLNVLLIDLTDFGVQGGGAVAAIRLDGAGYGIFELSGAAALNNLPLSSLSLLEFFDDAAAAGLLVGAGPGRSAENRLRALRSLVRVGEEAMQRETHDVSGPLREALLRVDGLPFPPDFAAGPCAPLLADRILLVLQDRSSP